MLATHLLDSYLEELQALKAEQDLLALIELYRAESEDHPSFQEFLTGEHAFYRNQYKAALRHYLSAKDIPLWKFCTLRASAFLMQQEGETEQALTYIKKALELKSGDPRSLSLLEQLKATSPSERPPTHSQALDRAEFDALSSLFIEDPIKFTTKKMEPSMTTETHTFSDKLSETHEDNHSSKAAVLDKLNQLANHYEVTHATDEYLKNIGMGSDTDKELQQQIDAFQEYRQELIAAYAKTCAKKRTDNHSLYILSGWDEFTTKPRNRGEELLATSSQTSAGGFYIRWNGIGLAINPGRNFLRNFHQMGLHIRDIDAVLVTHASPKAYYDIEALYNLNYQLNVTSPPDQLHIIHYYLNQWAHRDLSAKLKPNFKQERNTVHSLELYLDSPDVEKIQIGEGIALHYFSANASVEAAAQQHGSPVSSCLGVRLECTSNQLGASSVTLGFISGTGWSPALGTNLGSCDLLIAGFEETQSKDYRKVKYNEENLGYFGCYSLMEEVMPRLMLCCEFTGNSGDVRLEAIRKMRKEYAYSNQEGTSILPGDNGLYVDLKSMQVRCSATQELVDPSQIRIVKSPGHFGRLEYLSPSCVI